MNSSNNNNNNLMNSNNNKMSNSGNLNNQQVCQEFSPFDLMKKKLNVFSSFKIIRTIKKSLILTPETGLVRNLQIGEGLS